MEIYYIYDNGYYKIEQKDCAEQNYKEQIKSVCVILYHLVGQGVVKEISKYLANKFNIDEEKMQEAFFEFVENNSNE
jgi:hypothetical protein